MELPTMSFSLRTFLTIHAVILVLQLTFLFFTVYAAAAALSNETDKLALIGFKSQITEDPSGVVASWNESVDFCRWAGVRCSLRHERVISLNLQGQRLAGTISPHLGNLSFLNSLDLSENSLHGQIPQELSRLFRIQKLNLSFNLLGGGIPVNISHCVKLKSLILERNFLVGQIPSDVGSLTKLVQLYLRNNNLTGTIPASIGNLTSLQQLHLSYNNLAGQVPASIARLTKLREIGVAVNRLSGEFPATLYNLSFLELISISYNNFVGNLRFDIGNLFPNLQILHLAQNHFIGSIPSSLANATKLLQLDIPQNNFTGTVPSSFSNLRNLLWLNVFGNSLGNGAPDDLNFIDHLTNCSNLQFLHIGLNQFGGILPNSIVNLSSHLTRLIITGNQIRGTIPKDISNLVSLDLLYLGYNRLTGSIPDSVGNLPNLGNIGLDSNSLTGVIPPSIGNLTKLLYLYLSYNKLEGTIPPTLGNCKQLQYILLYKNNLSGAIPQQLATLSSLILVNVSYNSFTGHLPTDIGNWSRLISLDLSHNSFSSIIPPSLGNCLDLLEIQMQRNSLQGTIPNLGGLKNLQLLDLSLNNLSGSIPHSMGTLTSLIYLNLSFNNLEGNVPVTGPFSNLSALVLVGNRKLCGGIQELNLPPCAVQEPQRTRKKHVLALKFILVIVFVASFSILLPVIVFLYRRRSSKDQIDDRSTSGNFTKISYQQLLKATGGFSSENLIGSGGFGTVYKGTLGPNGMVVAVKVLNLQQEGASKSFIAECQALRNIRHRNLIKVITACSSADFKGNEFKALVYQYMPNGSLEEWLHPEVETPKDSLTILQRINIVTDVASALHYLHHQCQTSIGHCDIKPSNVLLDEDLTAHLGDFGLVRLLPGLDTEANLNQFSSLGVKGTIGYAAPEYGTGGKVSILGDMYSFGILILEIFTGRRPTDTLFQESSSLYHFVKTALPERVMEILDKTTLNGDIKGKTTNGEEYWANLERRQIECLVDILEIGVACSAESPRDRLTMRQVYSQLAQIKDKFLVTENR
ncbi:putative receptor-like protein kinase At3g47110 [Nicotiana tabacum]|uniref:non-specific serine/threonine protein kinase n=1 Tax=Nicotiana tabacum TaxID=4097 RepID=A0A1S3X288_TOBAC